jgi:predicted transcriptional regulator
MNGRKTKSRFEQVSQRELARLAEVDRATIRRLERGLPVRPSSERRVMRALEQLEREAVK